MRTIEKNVFHYSELSEKSQQKALHDFGYNRDCPDDAELRLRDITCDFDLDISLSHDEYKVYGEDHDIVAVDGDV